MKIGDLVRDNRGKIGIVINTGSIFPRRNGRTVIENGYQVRFSEAFKHSNNLVAKHTKWYAVKELEVLEVQGYGHSEAL